MRIEPGAGRVLRSIGSGLVMAILLWLALAAPGLVSSRNRTAAAPVPEARR